MLALAASVSWGVADFLGGLKSRTLPVLVVLALAQPVGLLLVGIVVVAGGAGTLTREALWAVPAALLATAGIAAFYRGMAIGTISIVAPIAASGAAIPVVAGVALGDRPGALQLLGFPLAVAGVVLASYETGGELGRAGVAAGVPWALLAAIGFGGYFVPMHEASESDFLWAALVFKASVAGLLGAVYAVVRPAAYLGRANLLTIVVIAIFDSGGNLFYAASASLGLVSVVSVLASLYPVTTVALAWLYLRESVTAVQRVGVMTALAGVVLVTAG